MGEIVVVNTRPEHFAGLEQLQIICYPTLDPGELMRAGHFAHQIANFPHGQFVALDGEQVVGQGSGFFTDFDFEHTNHTFRQICAEFYFTNHDPDGHYYYGADISVHPAYRRKGIGSLLYAARQGMVKRHGRKGIIAGGLIPGYAAHKQQMTPQDYVGQVIAGKLHDPTLTFQLRHGFHVRGLLQHYIEDSASDNWATLLEWSNPGYRGK